MAKCIKYCKDDIAMYTDLKKAFYEEHINYYNQPSSSFAMPYFPAFETLIKVYEKQEKFNAAIEICDLAIELGIEDNTKTGFEGRKQRLEKKKTIPRKNTAVAEAKILEETKNVSLELKNNVPANISCLPWYISVSFGETTSANLNKAIFLAKSSNYFLETTFNDKKIYQAFFSSAPNDFLKFVQLYELVSSWKSSFAMINGELVDRKIVSGINYCYGDKCRSGKSNFCYGASGMTDNPFGCHRLQISAGNHPWWTFSVKQGNYYIINKNAIYERAMEYSTPYTLCPCFNLLDIQQKINNLPSSISIAKYENNFNYGNITNALQGNITDKSNTIKDIAISLIKKIIK